MSDDLKTGERTRNTTLDILRGVAILIVVLGHSIQANLSTSVCVGGVHRSYGIK